MSWIFGFYFFFFPNKIINKNDPMVEEENIREKLELNIMDYLTFICHMANKIKVTMEAEINQTPIKKENLEKLKIIQDYFLVLEKEFKTQ
jgi:hypothetical protein